MELNDEEIEIARAIFDYSKKPSYFLDMDIGVNISWTC